MCITNRCALILKSIVESGFDYDISVRLIMSVKDLILEQNFEDLPIDFIALQIHSLYISPSSSIKMATLSLCMTLEQMSEESITEKYRFDFLIAASLGKPVKNDNQHDNEKIMALSYTRLLYTERGICPDSIVRSLVSFYQLMSSGPQYKTLFATTICSAATYVPEICHIPEVCQIIFKYLTDTGSIQVSSLVAHAIEKRQLLVADRPLLLSLLTNISTITPGANAFFSTSQANFQLQSHNAQEEGLINLLRTWQGIIFLGCQRKFLLNILMCLSNNAKSVCDIFRSLLCLDAPKESVVVPFSLFAMDQLFQLDIIGNLNLYKEQFSDAEKLLTELLPLTGVQLTDKLNIQRNQHTTHHPPVYLSLSTTQHPVINISDIQLNLDPALWDWSAVHLILSIILPHNEQEATSQNAQIFYTKLFDFFSGPFLMLTSAKYEPNSKSLLALIEMLISYKWGYQVIENSVQFKNAVSKLLHDICRDDPINDDSPKWILFSAVSHLMRHNEGIATLSRWGILSSLQKLGETCKNLKNAENVLSRISFYPDPELSVALFGKFLSSTKVEGMHRAALNELRSKQNEPGNFCTNIFNGVILPHIKECFSAKDNDKNKLNRSLALFHEIINNKEDCLLSAAKDKRIHEILSSTNKSIYTRLLSKVQSYEYCDISVEIDYWINEGNTKYVELFDITKTASFTNKLEETIIHYPEILAIDNHARIPPHLFSQLAKNAIGKEAIIKKLPQIIEKCQSEKIKERRGAIFAIAHFCSIPETSDIADSFNLVNSVIMSAKNDHHSYALLGTVIEALSMFSRTNHFMKEISHNGFKLLKSGFKSAIVPIDILDMIDDKEDIFETHAPNVNVPPPLQQAYNLVLELPNQLLAKEAQAALNALIDSPDSPFLDPGLAFLLSKTLSQCTVQADIRSNIYRVILEGKPLIRLNQYREDVDKREMTIANIMVDKASCMNKPNFDEIDVTENEINDYHSFGSDFGSYYSL